MGFLNPWLLLGLAGVAVPIIIHLLNRFRHKEVEWGAMELLRRAIVLRSRQIQLEDLLLLILRCLAVALIALAMARPTITSTGARWFGQKADVGMVLCIDASYSMDHRPGIDSRFHQAVRQAQEILQTVEPGTPVTLVLMGERPRILLRNIGYDPQRFDTVLKEMEVIGRNGPRTEPRHALPERLNLERNLEQIATLVDDMKAARRECFLVTDAQAISWGQLSDPARRAIEKIGSTAGLFLVATPAESSENVAITAFDLAGGAPRRGALVRYLTEVSNTGRTTVSGVTVSLLANDKMVDQRVIETLPGGTSRGVPLFVRLDQPGQVRLTASLKADALLTDNSRYALADVRETVRILLVDGDPSDKPFRGETDFLSKAFAPGANDGSLKIEKVSWTALPHHRLAEFDVVVLANVSDVRAEQAAAITSYVQQGGGLLITLGDKIDSKLYNARLGSDIAPLLPGELGERTKAAVAPGGHSEGWTIAAASAGHRLAYVLGLLPPQLLAEARVEEIFRLKLAIDARAIIETGENRLPLLAERSVGAGKVLLLTTTADRAWTNLPIHPVFPMLLHEAIGYVLSNSAPPPSTVGEPLVVALPAASVGGNVTFRDPLGRESRVQSTERGGRRIVEFQEPTLPGFYRVAGVSPANRAAGVSPADDSADQRGRDARDTMLLAVNVDPREASVAPLETEALSAVTRNLPLSIGDNADLAGQIRHARLGKELWRMLLLAGILVLAVESLLAHLFAKRIREGEKASLRQTPAELLSNREEC